MKLLRSSLILVIAVGTFSMFPLQVRAQQEVDPDHFDQPVAHAQNSKAQAQNSKAHSKAASVHHHSQANQTRVASEHGTGKAQSQSRRTAS